MSKTRIFVSSTCFDLGQVREDIKTCITQLGHEPLLSEYPSFPILPDLGAIENCKKNVRENTDIFVLIVSGKRGSLDADTDKPITNVEYETAKSCGIDTFVFVNRQVLDLLPIWEKNPGANFTPQVDNVSVFMFIKNLQADQRWIFTFEKASEITDIMKTQLSVFLRELINRKKSGKLKPIKEYLDETERALQIALDRPRFWEYLLTEELLRSKLVQVRRAYDDLQKGLTFRKSVSMKAVEFLDFAGAKFTDMISLIRLIAKVFTEEIPSSWGKPGEPGDPLEIKRAVDKLMSACSDMLEWEKDIISAKPPEGMQKLKSLIQGLTLQIIDELARVPDELIKPFRQPNPQGELVIRLVFGTPKNSPEIEAELKRLRNNPQV